MGSKLQGGLLGRTKNKAFDFINSLGKQEIETKSKRNLFLPMLFSLFCLNSSRLFFLVHSSPSV